MAQPVPRVLVPLTDGVEEMEAVVIIDVLRRAGWEVVGAGMKRGVITASRGVKIEPDAVWDDVTLLSFDALMIPGGKGARTLMTDRRILEALRAFKKAGKWIGAICAAPLVLHAAGILDGIRFTSFPGVAAELKGRRVDERVVVDGRVITSQGPGTTFEFALMLIRLIAGDEAADKVAEGLVLK